MLNVGKKEFLEKWTKIDDNKYICDKIIGEIMYEDDNYFVLKIRR